MIWPFSKKVLIPITVHFEQIIENMKLDDPSRWNLWEYIRQKYGVERKYSWRDNINYLVFESDREYLVFLLRL